ncbi:kinase-like protein [Atractiella rhizophila]|nr:kinase-like protein [Atractiella rhizophila]
MDGWLETLPIQTSTIQFLSSSPFSNSHIYKAQRKGAAEWVVVKLVMGRGRKPHDVLREIGIMKRTTGLMGGEDRNICPLLEAFASSPPTPSANALILPYYPQTLHDVLRPFPLPLTNLKSYAFQLLSAIEFLHSLEPPIAHRDICPSNFWIKDQEGVLGDFGVAVEVEGEGEGEGGSGGAEYENQVGTGAPELFFGYRFYDPLKADIWSYGCVVGEMILSLGLGMETHSQSRQRQQEEEQDRKRNREEIEPRYFYEEHEDEEDEEDEDAYPHSLFDASFGELALIASIYKLLGTPTSESWPSSRRFPDTDKIKFDTFPARDLLECLVGKGDEREREKLAGGVEVVKRCLVFESSRRVRADELLLSDWWTE